MPPSITFQQWSTNASPTPATSPANDDHDKPRHEWDFQLSSVVSPIAPAEASDVLGAIEFDPSDQVLATGGIARKIKIYTVGSLLSNSTNPSSYYICTPAKLSSLRWRPRGPLAIGAGDYDGVVTEYDVERRVPVFERDEHDGRRVWSIDYAGHVGASASEDGTAQLFDSRTAAAAAVLRPAGCVPVCSAEFDPSDEMRIGLGCADTNAYIYDARMARVPVSVLKGHGRTVTYVRFGSDGRVLTASTDGSIKMWDRSGSAEMRTFRGHVNKRSFVGLSLCWTGGLVGCGSESNEVYVYDLRWSEPVWVQAFGDDAGGKERGFVSAVAFRRKAETDDNCVAVAGGSDGVLKAWVGKKRRYLRI